MDSLQGLPEYVVFFSPSGVQYTTNLVTSGVLPLDQIKVGQCFNSLPHMKTVESTCKKKVMRRDCFLKETA